MKYLALFIFFSSLYLAIGQNHVNTFSIKAVVIDSLDFKTIPFVSIYKVRDKKGTISGFNGEFTIDNLLQNDLIVFSAIGYHKSRIVANKNSSYDTIYLNREIQLLDEVIVLADNSILYEMVSNVRKKHTNSTEIAKSYFELETYHDEQQLELFQGYYNGTYKGYNVSDLQMKNGRFALAPLSKRIFASTESSKAMYMHNLVESNEYFTVSPFELNKRKLKKYYSLSLNAKYVDNDDNTIYIISFTPRKDSNSYFAGKVWIDSLSNNILKTQLSVYNATVHPFRPFWPLHALDTVNLEITKSFDSENNGIRLKTVNFNYDLIYRSTEDSSFTISTQAVLHAYNYSDAFILPFFDYPSISNADYRRIQMLPNNIAFWNCIDEFRIENDESKDAFIKDKATIGSYNLFSSDTIFENNFFENPYVTWNGNRIIIKGLSADSSKYYDDRRTMYTDRYNFKVQLFVDINDVCDSIEIITKTIFDPYASYFHFETTKENQAFLNIYFDLMEIERRRLAIELDKVKGNYQAIERVYTAAIARADRMSNTYFKEVQRGTNKAELKKWNDFIVEEIDIDNFALFSIEME